MSREISSFGLVIKASGFRVESIVINILCSCYFLVSVFLLPRGHAKGSYLMRISANSDDSIARVYRVRHNKSTKDFLRDKRNNP